MLSCVSVAAQDNNTIMIDKEGYLLDPEAKGYTRIKEPQDIETYSRILNKIGDKKLIIFIHGGLNTPEDSLSKSKIIIENMRNKEDFYPLFVSWDSGLLSTYWDHLWKIRAGRVEYIVGPLTSPLQLVADLGMGIARTPFVFARQINAGIEIGTFYDGVLERNEKKIAAEIRKSDPEKSVDIPKETVAEKDKRGKIKKYFLKPLSFLVTLPTKILAAPFIDSGGKGSWDIMMRRTDTLFRKENEFDVRERSSQDINDMINCNDQNQKSAGNCNVNASPSGALARFFTALHNREMAKKDKNSRIEITIIGHSMGAIVANKIIQEYPELHYKKIVFLGGAASIRETNDSVFSYMMKDNGTEFFNVSLHPYAENGEINPVLDLPPRGSLLEWLDDFYTNPQSLVDRRIGKYYNIIQAIQTIPVPIRKRVHLKYFDVAYGSKKCPQKHGDFDEPQFNCLDEEHWSTSYADSCDNDK